MHLHQMYTTEAVVICRMLLGIPIRSVGTDLVLLLGLCLGGPSRDADILGVICRGLDTIFDISRGACLSRRFG